MDKGTKNLILGAIGCVILIFAIMLIVKTNAPTTERDKETSITGRVIKEDGETCREVKVPYEEVEEYIDQEPYKDIEYYEAYLNLESIYAVNQEKNTDWRIRLLSTSTDRN